MYQSYPNPFKFETSIRFQVLESEHVRIAIYDISGQLIEILSDKNFEPGFHRVNWDGKNQWGGEAAGKVFYCRLTTQSGFMDVINLIKL